jgi:hypothetical protein
MRLPGMGLRIYPDGAHIQACSCVKIGEGILYHDTLFPTHSGMGQRRMIGVRMWFGHVVTDTDIVDVLKTLFNPEASQHSARMV